MMYKALYEEKPSAVKYTVLPDGRADVWLRKNIVKTKDVETGAEMYETEEAYMRTTVTEAEVTTDFENWHETASRWHPPQPERVLTQDERISALEAENQDIKEQLSIALGAVNSLIIEHSAAEAVSGGDIV